MTLKVRVTVDSDVRSTTGMTDLFTTVSRGCVHYLQTEVWQVKFNQRRKVSSTKLIPCFCTFFPYWVITVRLLCLAPSIVVVFFSKNLTSDQNLPMYQHDHALYSLSVVLQSLGADQVIRGGYGPPHAEECPSLPGRPLTRVLIFVTRLYLHTL